MLNIRIVLLLGMIVVMQAVMSAAQEPRSAAAIQGCCQCGMCTDGDRCIEVATLAACSAACAAAGCQRVGFSTTRVCEDGCAAVRPGALLDEDRGEESAK